MPRGRWPVGLPTVLRLQKGNRTELPPSFADDDVRFSEGLVGELVQRLTRPGDVVLDPFAGFGTTLVVAEELGREGWGIELDPARAAYIRGRLAAPQRLIEGDARGLAGFAVPPVSLALCSPPYSTPGEEAAALTAYTQPNPGYEAYVEGLRQIFGSLGTRLRPDGWVVIEAGNVRTDRGLTLLAWDIARAVGQVLPFAGELVVHWEPTYDYGYDHSYCLVFAAPEFDLLRHNPGSDPG